MSTFTKILATLGPATFSQEKIAQLIKSGADGFRINTAHGDFKQYSKMVAAVRANGMYPIVLDIKGPELRYHIHEELQVRSGDTKLITFAHSASCFSNVFTGNMQVGDAMLFDDGRVRAKITHINKKGITVKFLESATIQPKKTIALPKRTLDIAPLSKKDRQAIKFAKEHKFAFIALSFTRDAEDVLRLKRLLRGSGVGIIAKIENQQGVTNAPRILQQADGLMVARGDLGVEISQENLPAVQKRLLRLCNEKGKIGIVATQVLESMVRHPRQTRAETSDVANAILDGADVLMLSEETAIGKYPKKCVQVISKIAKAIETEFALTTHQPISTDVSQAMAAAAATLAQRTRVNKIVALTKSGYTARQLARFRLRTHILAVTATKQVKEQLNLVFGVRAFLYKDLPEHGRVPWATEQLYKDKHIAKNDWTLFMAGVHTTQENVSNLLQLNQVRDILEYHKIDSKKK
jgi:pyruvate kinase